MRPVDLLEHRARVEGGHVSQTENGDRPAVLHDEKRLSRLAKPRQNISQAAQFAQSGSADAGVLALSLALSPTLKSSGTYVEIPASWYPPLEQAAVVLASSRQKAIARQFVDYLKKPDSVRILRSYGFAVPHMTTR